VVRFTRLTIGASAFLVDLRLDAACGGDQERRPERQPVCPVAAAMPEGAVMVVI
jgi:hypothetical protein